MSLNDLTSGWALWGSLLTVAILFGAFYFWKLRGGVNDFELQRRSRMLTAAERNFFECLANALSDDFYIFTKVRVLDVVEPSPASSRLHRQSIRKSLSTECLDYVLCKKHDLSIFGIVELENFEKRSNAKQRVRREKLISEVCKTANLRLFYFDIRQDYQGMDIRRLVTGRSKRAAKTEAVTPTHQTQLSSDGSSTTDYSRMRSCPKCHSEVVTKIAVKGKRIGEKFLMCRKYPYCDYQMSVTDAKAAKMEEKDKQRAAKPGFSDWSAS